MSSERSQEPSLKRHKTFDSAPGKGFVSGSTNPCSDTIGRKPPTLKRSASKSAETEISGTKTPCSLEKGPEIFDSENLRGPTNPTPRITRGGGRRVSAFYGKCSDWRVRLRPFPSAKAGGIV